MAEPKPKAEVKKFNKFLKQEKFTSKAGNDYILSYPGTYHVQKDIIDYSMLPNGTQSEPKSIEAMFKHLLQGNYGWKYWDDLVPEEERENSVTIKDFDGKDVTYDFKFPGFKRIAQINEEATAVDGTFLTTEYYKQLMKYVIVNGVDYKYWDKHIGYAEVMSAADMFIGTIVYNSEYTEVVDALKKFLNKMFR